MARQRKSISELASLLQVSPQAASRRTSGEMSLDLDEAAVIAEWLGIEVTALLTARTVGATEAASA